MSGLGTVVAITVNRHQWLPSLEVPEAIAIVALAEDAGVRLTTNIVNCDPDEVRIGDEVSVGGKKLRAPRRTCGSHCSSRPDAPKLQSGSQHRSVQPSVHR
jgi:uncharacterized OB-fold protein